MFSTLRALIADETGATAIEYGLIAALVSVAIIGGLGALGPKLNTLFTDIANALPATVGTGGTP